MSWGEETPSTGGETGDAPYSTARLEGGGGPRENSPKKEDTTPMSTRKHGHGRFLTIFYFNMSKILSNFAP